MALDPIAYQLKYFIKLEKVLTFERVLFKRVVIIYRIGEFSEIKGSIWNIPIENSNKYNFL